MDEYKAIMKTINNKLAEDEMRIEYLRGEVDKLNKELETVRFDNEGLMEENKSLINEVKRQDAVIQELKNAVKVVSKND